MTPAQIHPNTPLRCSLHSHHAVVTFNAHVTPATISALLTMLRELIYQNDYRHIELELLSPGGDADALQSCSPSATDAPRAPSRNCG